MTHGARGSTGNHGTGANDGGTRLNTYELRAVAHAIVTARTLGDAIEICELMHDFFVSFFSRRKSE
jgi:hypothetical protein